MDKGEKVVSPDGLSRSGCLVSWLWCLVSFLAVVVVVTAMC